MKTILGLMELLERIAIFLAIFAVLIGGGIGFLLFVGALLS